MRCVLSLLCCFVSGSPWGFRGAALDSYPRFGSEPGRRTCEAEARCCPLPGGPAWPLACCPDIASFSFFRLFQVSRAFSLLFP
ncbi:hypothetical protein VNO78_27602 [Psophocarpus tetragonolobus]|uniref:Uncharacterized protein n=1 Tax=Psophocarpus tetragonolobus TaxID=3891 RepID=A0AAN9S1B8_PSOTE